MAEPESFVPVAITRRSGIDESVHFGAVVALAADGSVDFAVGDPGVLIYPRSSTKPLLGTAMVDAGLRLPPELLALACASHGGMAMHTAGALRILASAGLTEAALANTPDLPLDEPTAEAVLRAGGGRTSLQMNCSGKHSAMLATCVLNGWASGATYLSPDHPLQRSISVVVDRLAGEPHAHVGIDGCGAPAHAMSLAGLAHAFRRIANGDAGDAGRAVYAAMTSNPEMVGGPRNDVTVFMRHVPGLMAKDGAEGVFAAALPDGRALAIKIADGAERARPPVMLAALAAMGVDVSAVAPLLVQAINGHGRPVGEVRSLLQL